MTLSRLNLNNQHLLEIFMVLGTVWKRNTKVKQTSCFEGSMLCVYVCFMSLAYFYVQGKKFFCLLFMNRHAGKIYNNAGKCPFN